MDRVHPLKKFRDRQKPPLAQAELAVMLGVTKTTVWRWEKGERFPERQHWARIREVTGITPDELASATTAPIRDDADRDPTVKLSAGAPQ